VYGKYLCDGVKDNKDFLHARFSIGDDALTPYKKIIKEWLYPDILNEHVRILRATRAISDYSKAIRDAKGEAELLTYFVECGNKFTLDYGDRFQICPPQKNQSKTF